MRTLPLVILFLIFMAACAGRAPAGPPLAPDETFVLVDPAAVFSSQPSDSADSLTLVSSEVAALRLRATGVFHVYRLVRDLGDWLEVETPGLVDDQCAADQPELQAFRLRLFVRASDLISATTRQLRLTFEDGTSATLLPGVPLTADGNLFVGGVVLRLNLPAGSVGRAYHGGARLEAGPGDHSLPAAELANVSVGGTPLRAVSKRPVAVYGTRPGLAGTLATLRTRCAELEVLTPPEMVKPISAPTDDSHSPSEMAAPSLRARAGATLYWKDGRVAGELRREVGFLDETGAVAGRRCLRWVPPSAHERSPTTFCLDPADVR